MTDKNTETGLRQRKGDDGISETPETEVTNNQTVEININNLSTWQQVKYYFNRFRYYHYKVAETIDLYASAACLWLINLYLRLFMGIGSEPESVLSEE